MFTRVPWEFGVAIDLGNWKVGVYYEYSIHEFTVMAGPLVLWCANQRDTGTYLPSGTFWRRRFHDREIRIDWSTHQFLFGYSYASKFDQGLYFGPLDIQIDRGF